jgi:hypothetical protein
MKGILFVNPLEESELIWNYMLPGSAVEDIPAFFT